MAADPGEGTFDDPAFGENDEAMGVGSLDDLDLPRGGFGRSAGQLRPLIAGVGEDALDEGEEAARAVIEDEPCSVAILHIGGMDDDVQQEAERVDENMALAARDLLARIEALRVECGAPF
jgi:hypothetical protein